MTQRENAVRVAIVEDERPHSSVWRIWGRGNDIYVAARSAAGHFKTSLHASGKFRHAFVTEADAQKFLPPGADRAVSKWDRPQSQAPLATLLFHILLPEALLRASRVDYPLPKNLVRLPRPQPKMVTYISIFEMAQAAGDAQPIFDGYTVAALASWKTGTGTTIRIMAHDMPLTPEQEAQIGNLRRTIATRTQADVLTGIPPGDLRGFALTESPDGIGRILDFSAEFLRDREDSVCGESATSPIDNTPLKSPD